MAITSQPQSTTPQRAVTGAAWQDSHLPLRSRRLVVVYGNNGGPELRRRLPETVDVVPGLRFAMVHETGAARGKDRRAEALFPDADVLVFGHSHIPWDTTSPRDLRLFNPGSPPRTAGGSLSAAT